MGKQSRHVLFVGGFFGVTAVELQRFFCEFGEVESVHVKGNGFAFVEFKKKDGAANALGKLEKLHLFKEQFVFGKQAEKKSIKKRERNRSKKDKAHKRPREEEPPARGDKNSSLQEPSQHYQPQQQALPLVAPDASGKVSFRAMRGKDAVYLSSDEDDM